MKEILDKLYSNYNRSNELLRLDINIRSSYRDELLRINTEMNQHLVFIKQCIEEKGNESLIYSYDTSFVKFLKKKIDYKDPVIVPKGKEINILAEFETVIDSIDYENLNEQFLNYISHSSELFQ